MTAPENWSRVKDILRDSPASEVREKTLLLSVMFGDPEAAAALRKTVADPKQTEATRRAALQTLVEARAPACRRCCANCWPTTRCAVRPCALAAFNDADTPALILKHYHEYTDAEKADAVATLASRPTYAMALLDAMSRGEVPTRDLSSFTRVNSSALTTKTSPRS